MENKRISPLKSIRKFCLTCVENSEEVRNCDCDGNHTVNGMEKWLCPLFEYRFGHKPIKYKLSVLRAIRKHCLYCVNNSPKEVELCPDMDCFLWIYRFGKNPFRKGIGGVGPSILRGKNSSELRFFKKLGEISRD